MYALFGMVEYIEKEDIAVQQKCGYTIAFEQNILIPLSVTYFYKEADTEVVEKQIELINRVNHQSSTLSTNNFFEEYDRLIVEFVSLCPPTHQRLDGSKKVHELWRSHTNSLDLLYDCYETPECLAKYEILKALVEACRICQKRRPKGFTIDYLSSLNEEFLSSQTTQAIVWHYKKSKSVPDFIKRLLSKKMRLSEDVLNPVLTIN